MSPMPKTSRYPPFFIIQLLDCQILSSLFLPAVQQDFVSHWLQSLPDGLQHWYKAAGNKNTLGVPLLTGPELRAGTKLLSTVTQIHLTVLLHMAKAKLNSDLLLKYRNCSKFGLDTSAFICMYKKIPSKSYCLALPMMHTLYISWWERKIWKNKKTSSTAGLEESCHLGEITEYYGESTTEVF